MSYVLHGVIGSATVLRSCLALANAVVLRLDQGLYLLPMTDDLFAEVRKDRVPDQRFADSYLLPPGFEQTLAVWSMEGAVAYVEADYLDGVGSQFAAVWHNGELIFGPISTAGDAPPKESGRSLISQALRHLGAAANGQFDEFDAVGLHKHRAMQEWIDEEAHE